MLSDIACKALIKEAVKLQMQIKKADRQGLYLHAFPNGSAYWRFKYRVAGKEKKMALGVYPEVPLVEAREKHRIAHKMVSDGKDPVQVHKEILLANQLEASNTFQLVALEWHGKHVDHWDARYAKTIKTRLEQDIFPEIGHLPIGKIPPEILLAALRKIENRKAVTIARKCLGYCGQIFRYSNATGRPAHDVSTNLYEALKRHKVTHHRAMEAKDLPDFMYRFDRNEKNLGIDTRNLVEMMLHTFVRTNELRKAEKRHINLAEKMWHIPGEWMKMDEDHLVPLSRQVIALIKKQMNLHPKSPYLFPSNHSTAVYLSEGTINSALVALGVHDIHTGHGFRALAKSTLMEKLNYRQEVADVQLAHAPKSSNGRAYDRAKFLSQRKQMMQKWSDYIDKCRLIGLTNRIHDD